MSLLVLWWEARKLSNWKRFDQITSNEWEKRFAFTIPSLGQSRDKKYFVRSGTLFIYLFSPRDDRREFRESFVKETTQEPCFFFSPLDIGRSHACRDPFLFVKSKVMAPRISCNKNPPFLSISWLSREFYLLARKKKKKKKKNTTRRISQKEINLTRLSLVSFLIVVSLAHTCESLLSEAMLLNFFPRFVSAHLRKRIMATN